MLKQQAEDMETPEEAVYSTMENSFEVMKESVLNGMDKTLRSSSGLSGGAAAKLKKRRWMKEKKPLRPSSWQRH